MRAFLVKTALRVFSFLPLRAVHALGAALGRVIEKLPEVRIASVMRVNIALACPHLPPGEQRALVKNCLKESAKCFVELGSLWFWPVPRVLALVREVSDTHLVEKALRQGHGVILLTPHLGAWELAGLYASSRFPLTILYRRPRLVALERMLTDARGRCGGQVVRADRQGIRTAYRALNNHTVVGILPDQDPGKQGKGVFAPFFGVPTYTQALVPRLVQRTGAKVIFTYAERLPKSRGFRIRFFPAPEAIASADPVEAATSLNQGIERCIQTCPAQYQWGYKRFKSQPQGAKNNYEL
ncbi:MAG: lipid A biosynthesis acyltransferase [Gammaproteobacteria bacterium]|nr:lipid A biosynthesis acyltransferase [Gammaproteobacteria bacterium]